MPKAICQSFEGLFRDQLISPLFKLMCKGLFNFEPCSYCKVIESERLLYPLDPYGVAFVVPRQGGPDLVSGDALISHCRELLAPYKAPRQIYLLDELPKNGVGKIRKDQLAARLPPL